DRLRRKGLGDGHQLDRFTGTASATAGCRDLVFEPGEIFGEWRHGSSLSPVPSFSSRTRKGQAFWAGPPPGSLLHAAPSPALFLEELLHSERGHAAGACGRDRLAVAAVLYVAAGVHAVDDLAMARGEDIVLRADVAFVVEIDLAVEHLGVGDVTDAQE